ncbi:DUF6624 domain-containing protein [Streptomyces tauricus]
MSASGRDFGVDLLRCLWRAEGVEASMPRRDAAAATVIAGIFAGEAELLRGILDTHGWPGYELVGERASLAAWRIAMYCPTPLQARAAELLERAARTGDADPLHFALLADRICLNRGEPQHFGTLYIPTRSGLLKLYPVKDPQRLDDRRHALGLEPHAAWAERLQAESLSPKNTAASG